MSWTSIWPGVSHGCSNHADYIFAQHEAKPAATASSVPVDDTQQDCALSGERFTTFWHEATESWHFQDAIRLHGEEANR